MQQDDEVVLCQLPTPVIESSTACSPRHLNVLPRRDPAEALTVKLAGLMKDHSLCWHVQAC